MPAPDKPQQGQLLYDEVDCSDLGSLTSMSLFCDGSLGDDLVGDGDSSSCQSEGKDSACEVTSEGTGESSESVPDEDSGSSFQRNFEDQSLPDLINSGRPLGRRRTLGHVSDTLKEVRREVELSRRRSIKLKAQVDKLQERREGTGWGQHRETVTEEVLSILRLLHPLTRVEFSAPDQAETQLDTALVQLKIVARQLAVGHTQQGSQHGKKSEDSEVLEQALRDRDEAIEKKQAMEAELLRSKTELMMLNNQLLEAAQKRLELSLELEAWKEDVQIIISQQLQSQQQAEQVQKKPSRMGLLRRTNKAPIQRPSTFPLPPQTPPATRPANIYVAKPVGSPTPARRSPPATGTLPRNWMAKLKRNKNSRQPEPESPGARDDDGFHVVSLD